MCGFYSIIGADLWIQELFKLPTLGPVLATLRDTLINGQGFWLFKNIPVRKWSSNKCATAYMVTPLD